MPIISASSIVNACAGKTPQRVVSLCPGITELLFDIGMKERVAGVSKQCRFPEVRVKDAARVGSNRRPDLKQIQELEPDLVVVDSRETDTAVVSLLKEEYLVWDSNVTTVLGAIAEIRALGTLVDKVPNAEWIAEKIETRFAEFQASFQLPSKPVTAVMLANYKPWTAFGSDTISTELLGLIGVQNAWAMEPGVFPVEQRKIPGAAIVLLAEGPYSFHKRHVPVVARKFPDATTLLVREDLLTWPGSRLLRAPQYLTELAGLLNR